jgi:hypothetical protein
MITEYLVKRTVIFICEKCGDTVSMYVPSSGESNVKSYCCNATYEVVDRRGDILIERLADRDEKAMKELDAVPVNYTER